MTRRETIVAVLRGTNGYSIGELNAAYAVPGVQAFLTAAEQRGITNGDLAEQLEAFKASGRSGLQNAITAITAENFGATSAKSDACVAAVESAKAALKQAQAALDAVS